MNRTYTQEQLDIELLKESTTGLGASTQRIERRLDSIDANIKLQYHNFTNYILGTYGVILAAILAHIGGMF
jgi:hypothetical protein